MNFLVIIPTYNENKNIASLLSLIESLNVNINLEVLVIDDASPDGTAETIKKIMIDNNKIHLIERSGKLGLASAYCEGFKWALDNNYDYIIQMDADLSHDPNDILKFIKQANSSDIVVGSRYKTGVNVVNWPLRRLILSYFANIYARIFTGINIYDLTSGFKCIKANILNQINLDKIRSEGYSFQIEINFLLWLKGCSIKEIPITFTDRTVGDSKMSKKIIYEAIYMVPMLRLKKILRVNFD